MLLPSCNEVSGFASDTVLSRRVFERKTFDDKRGCGDGDAVGVSSPEAEKLEEDAIVGGSAWNIPSSVLCPWAFDNFGFAGFSLFETR